MDCYHGSFESNNTVTSKTTVTNKVDVWWNDVAATGKLKVVGNCSSGSTFTVNEEKYAILTLKNRVPANPRANQLLPYCSTGSIQLAVDVMFLNNTGGDTGVPQKRADGYEWTLPAGWSSSGSTGVVHTSSEFINITPDNGCRGGTVKVRAYIQSCGTKYSSEASININRTGFSNSLQVPSGYPGPRCGVVNAITFTAANLSCASSYRWTATGTGWKEYNSGSSGPWTTATNTITLVPTGTSADDGVISADINIGCTTLTQTYRAIYADPKPTPPVFDASSAKVLCSNSSGTVSVQSPAANQYVWYAVGDVQVNNQNTSISNPVITSTPNVTIKAPALSTYQGYYATLFVTTSNGSHCQSSFSGTHFIDIGVPTHDKFDIVTYGFSYPTDNLFYACPEAKIDLYVRANYVHASLEDQWTITGSYGWVGPQTGRVLTFAASPYPREWAYPTYRARNACGWGTYETASIGTLDCNGGEEPWFTYPNPTSDQLMVSIEQSLEEEPSLVMLTNLNGKVVYKENTKASQLTINVKDFDPGVYQLSVKNKNGTKQKRIIVER